MKINLCALTTIFLLPVKSQLSPAGIQVQEIVNDLIQKYHCFDSDMNIDPDWYPDLSAEVMITCKQDLEKLSKILQNKMKECSVELKHLREQMSTPER